MNKLFAVRDVKGNSYTAPVAMATRGIMIRVFAEAVNHAGSDFNKYPEDYSLYEIGEYEPNTASIKPYAVPEFVISASEALTQIQAARQAPASVVAA